MYDARKISNLLMSEFDAQQWDLSNLKLNKILFFIQGWAFVRLDRKVIKNHFVAWQHGPVVKSIWQEFQQFGSSPITEQAKYLNYSSGNLEVVSFVDVDQETRTLIQAVAPFYLKKSASELRALTHLPSTPWDMVRRQLAGPSLSDKIPDNLISSYFKSEFGRQYPH